MKYANMQTNKLNKRKQAVNNVRKKNTYTHTTEQSSFFSRPMANRLNSLHDKQFIEDNFRRKNEQVRSVSAKTEMIFVAIGHCAMEYPEKTENMTRKQFGTIVCYRSNMLAS